MNILYIHIFRLHIYICISSVVQHSLLFSVDSYASICSIKWHAIYSKQINRMLSTEHYDDVIMTTIASQITSLTSVYSTVYSDAHQRKHQSSASLAFVWGIHRDRWIPRTKGQLRGKCFHLMTSSWYFPLRGWLNWFLLWHSTMLLWLYFFKRMHSCPGPWINIQMSLYQ